MAEGQNRSPWFESRGVGDASSRGASPERPLSVVVDCPGARVHPGD